MSHAPIDLAIMTFPGNRFRGEIIPALERLVERDTIQIIDLIFLMRDTAGNVTVVELAELGEDEYASWEPLVGSLSGMLSQDDALAIADAVEPGSSAALVVFENSWATELAGAIRRANGELILNERIPRVVVDHLQDYLAQA